MGDQFPYPVTLVEITKDYRNLIYINESFLCETLYRRDDIIGANCKFLQGPETDTEAVARIRNALNNFKPICQDLINYKKNGEIFYNRLVLIPFVENKKKYVIGLQHVIPKEKFKTTAYEDQTVLDDRTKNPLTVIALLLVSPVDKMENRLKVQIERLRTFVLSL